MITRYPYANLGHANQGWLDARHHFSFADYYNPARHHFGALRVINDDRVDAGAGFASHPHNNMEIITYVRAGAITHRDSVGNEGRTAAGDVQVMSAGSGVYHSEMNAEAEPTRLYQIWITPNERDVTPRWAAREFPKTPVTDRLHLLVSGRAAESESGALTIHQDAAIFGGRLRAGSTLTHTLQQSAYVLASAGSFTLNDTTTMHEGDGAEVTAEKTLCIHATTDAEILIIEVPNEN